MILRRKTRNRIATDPNYTGSASTVEPSDVAEVLERLLSDTGSFGTFPHTVIAKIESVPTPPHGTNDMQMVVMVDRGAFEVRRRGSGDGTDVTVKHLAPDRVEAVVAEVVARRSQNSSGGGENGEGGEAVDTKVEAGTMHLEILAGNGYGVDADVEKFYYGENGLVVKYANGFEECYPDAGVWAGATNLEDLDEDLVPHAKRHQ